MPVWWETNVYDWAPLSAHCTKEPTQNSEMDDFCSYELHEDKTVQDAQSHSFKAGVLVNGVGCRFSAEIWRVALKLPLAEDSDIAFTQRKTRQGEPELS